VNFEVVFDLRDAGYDTWHIALIGLFFGALGAAGVFGPRAFRQLIFRGASPRTQTVLVWFVFVIGCTNGFGFLLGTYREYRTTVAALEAGQVDIVEGRVTEFRSTPSPAGTKESFRVGKRRFAYHDTFCVEPGFRRTQAKGSPIGEGTQVRMTHIGNRILKLEVAR
jgi:hypothetical protein